MFFSLVLSVLLLAVCGHRVVLDRYKESLSTTACKHKVISGDRLVFTGRIYHKVPSDKSDNGDVSLLFQPKTGQKFPVCSIYLRWKKCRQANRTLSCYCNGTDQSGTVHIVVSTNVTRNLSEAEAYLIWKEKPNQLYRHAIMSNLIKLPIIYGKPKPQTLKVRNKTIHISSEFCRIILHKGINNSIQYCCNSTDTELLCEAHIAFHKTKVSGRPCAEMTQTENDVGVYTLSYSYCDNRTSGKFYCNAAAIIRDDYMMKEYGDRYSPWLQIMIVLCVLSLLAILLVWKARAAQYSNASQPAR